MFKSLFWKPNRTNEYYALRAEYRNECEDYLQYLFTNKTAQSDLDAQASEQIDLEDYIARTPQTGKEPRTA
jgi:hypothetical protein